MTFLEPGWVEYPVFPFDFKFRQFTERGSNNYHDRKSVGLPHVEKEKFGEVEEGYMGQTNG